MHAKVSVIITCYNVGFDLIDCINSVKSQTFASKEIILIDDGSTEKNTLAVIDSLTNDLSVKLIQQANTGVCMARNNAAKHAQGKYIAFLDGDDKIEKTYLTKAIAKLEAAAEIDIVYCDLQEIGDGKQIRILPEFKINEMLLYNANHPCSIMRMEVWQNSEGFNNKFKHGWEDWDFWLTLADKGHIAYKIPEALFFYRIKTHSRDKDAVAKHHQSLEQLIFKEHLNNFFDRYPNIISVLRHYEILIGENKKLEVFKSELSKSWSYRIGHFVLFPLKKLRRFFKKG